MGQPYEAIERRPTSPVFRVVTFAASLALFFVAFAAARTEWRPALALEDVAAGGEAELATFTEISVNYTTLLAVDGVCDHVAAQEGLHDCLALSEDVLLKYVPRRLRLKIDHDLVRSSIGAAAMGGYLAFNMVWQDSDNSFFSSWFVVMSYEGEITTMTPLREGGDVYRAAGFKPWSAAEFVFAAGKDTLLTGYAYKLDWAAGTYSRLSTVEINTHDVQKAYAGDAFWSGLPDSEFQETCVDIDAACPDSYVGAIQGAPKKDVHDINHVQAIDDDAHLVISSRTTNTIYKVHASNGSKIWALGGDDGEYGIVGSDGAYYAPGESYWVGQHNAEYIGKSEYAMFDNNYDRSQRNSRLLVVALEPDEANATVVWEYDVGTYSQVFGDNDRMPSGNMLACWWPTNKINGSDAYEARVAEITRDASETAFQLDIYGRATCESGDECDRTTGWLMYSVERFYDAPLVWDVTCDGRAVGFKAANVFKQASVYSGTYAVTDAKGDDLASGTFDWGIHWRTADVTARLSATSKSGSLYVENQFGQNTTVAYDCTE